MRAFTTATLVAIVACTFLGWQVVKLARLDAKGIRAEGQIVRLKEERHVNFRNRGVADNVEQTNYHAIVKFRTQDNQTIEFEDFAGEYLPIFRRPSATVTVLYLASDPVNSAIIDRGPFWNWVTLAMSFNIYFR